MHPLVRQKYKDAELDIPQNEIANSNNEEVFLAKVKIAKKPVTHKIIKVVRVRVKGKESVYYHETLRSKDFLNNHIDHTRVVGKYEDPQFITYVDPKTNQPRPVEVQELETVYEFPWTPNIIDQWLSQEDFELDEGCGYIVKDGGKVYGGYTYEQFCTESYDDLVTLGKFGTKEKGNARKTKKPSE